jgi:methyl-accepting chemotaxis protein
LSRAATEAAAKQLKAIVEGVTKASGFLKEIARENKEQTQGISQIAEGLDQIYQATQSRTAENIHSVTSLNEMICIMVNN